MYSPVKDMISPMIKPASPPLSTIIALIAILFVSRPLLKRLFFKRWPVNKGGAVLITGTSSGIGRAATVELVNHGYIVYATVRKIEDAQDLKNDPGIKDKDKDNVRPVLLDVTHHETISQAHKTIKDDMEKDHFRFAGVYSNAGYMTQYPVEYHDVKDMEAMFATNVFGNLRVIQEFLPLIREHQGRIVLMSSLAGRLSQAKQGCYCATKHAIEAFGDALRQELYPHNVAVAMIEPGFTATALVGKVLESEGGAAEDATIRDTYPHLYRTFQKAKIDMSAKMAANVQEPAKQVLDAFTNPYPKTRYPCSNVGGVPASVVLLVRGLFNDRLFDWLLR